MLTAARRSATLLGESAGLVVSFIADRLAPDGGFRGRSDEGDLYYSVFALGALVALQAAIPAERLVPWIESLGDGASLDLVHLACLARCRAVLSVHDARIDKAILDRIESHRSRDGGYAESPDAASATAYGCFLAAGAYQDLGASVPDPQSVAGSLAPLRRPEGGYGNSPEMPGASVPSTAAVIILQRHLGRRGDESAAAWLKGQFRPYGGVGAWPGAPASDLLSTAVALYALRTAGVELDDIREACLDFVDSLWSRGGFHGCGADLTPDCEYTFYGLLALGSLDTSS